MTTANEMIRLAAKADEVPLLGSLVGVKNTGEHLKKALDFVMDVRPPPDDVQALEERDNIIGMCWRKSGTGYLQWCERLSQAAEGNRPLYRVCNDVRGTFVLPQYDYLHNVTSAVVEGEGETFCELKAADIRAALNGLCKGEGITEAYRKDLISFVFPYIYRARPFMGGFFFGKNARLFRARMNRLARMERAINTETIVFACSGWFLLLYDIARGFDFPFEDGDSPLLGHLKHQARSVDSSYAQSLLDHAQSVMTSEELCYDWPDELKK